MQEGWERIEPDIFPDHGSFTDTQALNMSTNSHEPEDFFSDIFDDRMAEEKITMPIKIPEIL